jgi:hypothetical protein
LREQAGDPDQVGEPAPAGKTVPLVAEGLPQLFHGMEEAVAQAVLEHVPELFNRVELWTVDGQPDEMNSIGQGTRAAFLVEPGSVPDDDVFGFGFTLGPVL